ncbi:MAG: hypothetical protein ACFE9T_05760 [Promethearchaeota archaeon]
MLEIIENNMDYICLECGKEYKNKFNIAICQDCLEKEKEKFKKGIASNYMTVNLFLEKKFKSNKIKHSI